jgi:hypothetical protein
MVPVLGLATAAVGARALIRSGKIAARPSLETLLWALGAAVLASNVEVVRAATAIPRQVDATVGRNIPWSWPELWSFALGTRYGGFERIQTDRSVAWAALTIVATGLLMVGLLRPVAAGRSLPLGVALGGLLALGMYFAVAVRDPWTGLSGHTWSLFKIGQWAFPLALGFESAGLALIAGGRSRGRSRPPRRRWTRPSWLRPSWIAIGMVALVVPLALPAQVSLARARAGTMRAATLSDQPFEAYRQLRDSVARLQPSRIYLIDPRGELWPRGMVAYYLSDWPIVLVDERTALREQGAGARQLSLLVTQPVAGCVERLPAGVGLLEPGPVIVAVRWPDGTRETGREGSLRLPGGKTTLRVWSPRAGLAWISGRGTANAGGSRVSESRLRFETDAGQTGEVGVGEAPFTLEMEVPVGGSDLKLEAARRVELTDLTIGFADAAGASERCSAE